MKESTKKSFDKLSDVLKNRKMRLVLSLVLCIIVEICISNYTAIAMMFSHVKECDLDLSFAHYSDDIQVRYTDKPRAKINKGTIRFENVNVPLYNVCIEFSQGGEEYYYPEIAYTDDNFACEDGLNYNKANLQIFVGNNVKSYCNVRSYGNIGTLEVRFPSDNHYAMEVDSIKINSPQAFHISYIRLIFLISACVCIFLKAWKWHFSKKDHLILYAMAGVACFVLIGSSFFISKVTEKPMLDEYPLENEVTMDQYQQLFSSFKEGRLYINVNFSPEEYEQMQNPYDRSERDSTHLTGDQWDRAYYNGKFYSYFGVAPVFTVYFPVFLVTHKVAGSVLACTISAIYAVICMTILYSEVIKRFCKNTPFIFVIAGLPVIWLSSSVFALASDKYFYFIAVISAITAVAGYLAFLIKAYYETSVLKKTLYFVITGAFVVLMAASRPGTIVYCMTAVAPLLWLLKDKEISVKHKILYLCSIGVPVMIGAVSIMIYNYARFSSPLEFGFTYQITVSSAEANKILVGYIPFMIFHYFLQPLEFKTKFPYFDMPNTVLSGYPRYTYLAYSMGAFNYPVMWGSLFLPYALKKEDKFKTNFTLTLFISVIIVAFLNMCKAGVHYRYVSDILLPLGIVSIIVLFKLAEIAAGSTHTFRSGYYITLSVIFIITIVIGYLMIFANENELFINDYALITQILRTM